MLLVFVSGIFILFAIQLKRPSLKEKKAKINGCTICIVFSDKLIPHKSTFPQCSRVANRFNKVCKLGQWQYAKHIWFELKMSSVSGHICAWRFALPYTPVHVRTYFSLKSYVGHGHQPNLRPLLHWLVALEHCGKASLWGLVRVEFWNCFIDWESITLHLVEWVE